MTQPPYGGPAHPPGDQPPHGQPPHPPETPFSPPYGGQPPAPGYDHQPSGYGQPGYAPPPGYLPYGPPPAPKKKRGLLIASLVLVVVLLLCGGGATAAFLLLRDTETGEGAAEPVAAVESFLKAVYTEKDATKAAALVCSESRNEQEIADKVEEVKGYAKTYKTPLLFRWEKPKIDKQDQESAVVSVKLSMITADEKTADQQLTFTVVQKTGWWVCEVGS